MGNIGEIIPQQPERDVVCVNEMIGRYDLVTASGCYGVNLCPTNTVHGPYTFSRKFQTK